LINESLFNSDNTTRTLAEQNLMQYFKKNPGLFLKHCSEGKFFNKELNNEAAVGDQR